MGRRTVILLLLLIISLSGCSTSENDYLLINDERIEIIWIADDAESAYKGLSHKKSICYNCGMLFKFDEKDTRTFVMRDMLFPLDIIWIDGNEIVKIDKNLLPEGSNVENFYNSSSPVDTVLEVNAGLSDKFDIKPGDTVNFNLKEYEQTK